MKDTHYIHSDIDRASALFCDELATMKPIRLRTRKGEMSSRSAARKLRAAPLQKRRRVGERLLVRYRKDTGCQGAIDWSKFHKWLKEHMGELTFLKIILSVITILLIL